MVRFLLRLVVNAVAIWVTALLLDGIGIRAADSTGGQLLVLGVVALVFTLVNMVVRPIAQLLSLPLVILTLGLFSLVINALMLLLTGWLTRQLGYGLEVDGFWWALAGAIIISVVAWLLNLVLPKPR